jgi:hypothetical protein
VTKKAKATYFAGEHQRAARRQRYLTKRQTAVRYGCSGSQSIVSGQTSLASRRDQRRTGRPAADPEGLDAYDARRAAEMPLVAGARPKPPIPP